MLDANVSPLKSQLTCQVWTNLVFTSGSKMSEFISSCVHTFLPPIKGNLFSKKFIQMSTLSDFSSNFFLWISIWLVIGWGRKFEFKFWAWIGCKKFRGKMDENSDSVDIWINLFDIKLPLLFHYFCWNLFYTALIKKILLSLFSIHRKKTRK